MTIDPTLYDGYIGQNAAHMAFKREIVNAKVLFFQIRGNRDHLKADFEATISDARKLTPGSFSVNIVTEVFSQTEFRAVVIPHNEAGLVFQDYESLEVQLNALLFMDLQRILESYLLDLFAEIARKNPRVLVSERTVTHREALETESIQELLLEKRLDDLSRSPRKEFHKQFELIGLPIIRPDGSSQEEREFLTREFILLWEIRNLLQHNHGVINNIFLEKVPGSGYQLGNRVIIDVPMLGRAFVVAEGIADELNRRGVEKFGLP
ncbi:MAG: hypothetical protein M3458_14115 [Acidobacteriota bacterium]|nr:hypothetical protein [Acidobacteriota bacterium]